MSVTHVDVLLVGGGVMSATLGTLLAQLDPGLSMVMVERLDQVAHESSDGWSNAGTGHAGYCELNYTPQAADGSVEVKRALAINADFELTLQFMSHLVEHGLLPAPDKFINRVPHLSFVAGDEDAAFLRARYQALRGHAQFAGMQFSDDPEVLRQWMPLVMAQRDTAQPVAATRVEHGTDIDFGALTRGLIEGLRQQQGFSLLLAHSVRALEQDKQGRWHVHVHDRQNNKSRTFVSRFVFLGAGGGALPLLQKSGIPESKGYGGFPVSGQWLICNDPAIVQQHHAKVYGKAPLGAPPMSVPHLDTRIINGQRALLFGPYAGFTTKFLKQGSYLDLIKSVSQFNLKPMLSAGWSNVDLTRYLIGEALQTPKQRNQALRSIYPQAHVRDWTLANAGKRVQIIKGYDKGVGKLEFGTEVVTAQDGTLATLLGASPGASVATRAMLGIIERCFSSRLAQDDWQQKLRAMIPSYGHSLSEQPELLATVRERNLRILRLA